MKVLFSYTLRTLLKNKTRTWATVIGIALSMALVTAVIQGANSGLTYLERQEIAENGSFHGYFYDLSEDELADAQGLSEIKSYSVMREVGWANIQSENEYKPYLLIESTDEKLTDLLAVHLISGRLPEDETELLLPAHLSANGGVDYALGDTLTLEVGRRDAEGYTLTQQNPYEPESEKLTDTVTRRYTVVGFYERFSSVVENYSCPGYMALTRGGEYIADCCTLFFSVKHPGNYFDWEATAGFNSTPHNDLLRLSGSFRSSAVMQLLYGFAAILVFLIALGSVSLIYNSFSMSVSQRTRQFGTLKSVGATRHQIGVSVLYEALLLCAFAIPLGLIIGCLGIGVTLYALKDAFSSFLAGDGTVKMTLVISPAGLLVSVLVGLLTTLISAWIPARRATTLTPIDAIWLTGDVKIRNKTVKTSRLISRLFGFEGMLAVKNFKRSKKQYRATVISLLISVTLFISASSFCSYLTDSISGLTAPSSRMDITYYIVGEEGEKEDPDEVYALLSSVKGVTAGEYLDYVSIPVLIDGQSTDVLTVFLQDEAFDALCLENGLDLADFHGSYPQGVLYNQGIKFTYTEDGKSLRTPYSLPVGELPCGLLSNEILEFEGLTQWETVEENGVTYYLYYDVDYISSLWSDFYEAHPDGQSDEGIQADPSMAVKKLTDEEATSKTVYRIAAEVSEPPLSLSNADPVLIYPYSAETLLLGKTQFQTDFSFRSDNHKESFDGMTALLNEAGMDTNRLYDEAANKEGERMLLVVIKVFSYGFIILISLIAAANVFNTLSANLSVRRRELAMLQSVGMTGGGFMRMLCYECLVYGFQGLFYGLLSSVAVTYLIWRVTGNSLQISFYLPWASVLLASVSVFAVVFASMLYATQCLRRENLIENLRSEVI